MRNKVQVPDEVCEGCVASELVAVGKEAWLDADINSPEFGITMILEHMLHTSS